MKKIFSDIIKWDNLFWKNSKKFKKEVKKINSIFKLKEDEGFVENHPPTFFVGNIYSKKIKYIFVGLNPGFSKTYNKREIDWRRRNRKKPSMDCVNLFDFFKEKRTRWPPYFSRLVKLCNDFKGKNNSKEEKVKFCKDCVVNIDVLPFHSKGYKIKLSMLNSEQLKEFFKFWSISKKLIKKISGKFIIITGRENYILMLLDNDIGYKKLELKYKIGNIHIYTFRIGNKKAILIDAFLGGGKNMSLKKGEYKEIIREVKALQKCQP